MYLAALIGWSDGVKKDVSWMVGKARKAAGTVKENCGRRMVIWE